MDVYGYGTYLIAVAGRQTILLAVFICFKLFDQTHLARMYEDQLDTVKCTCQGMRLSHNIYIYVKYANAVWNEGRVSQSDKKTHHRQQTTFILKIYDSL